MFKPGQNVIILKVYNLQTDGAAVIVRQIDQGRDKGKWLLDMSDSGYIIADESRLVDANKYWKALKDKRESTV